MSANTATAPSQKPTDRASGLRAWTVTSMVVAFATINWADKALIGLVAQPLAREFGLTATQIGFAGSAFFFLFSVTGALVGFLGDRFQIRWLLFAMAAGWGFTQFPILISGTFAILLACRIALGALEGPATALGTTAVFQWFPPEKRGFPAALVTSGSSFAKIVAAPLLALVIAAAGWRSGFMAMAIASFVWCAMWLVLGKEGPFANPRAIRDTPQATAVPRGGRRHILTSKSFIGALLATFAAYGVVSASVTWIPSYFEKGLGYSELNSGLMFGLPSIASVVFMYGATFVTDRLGNRGNSGRIRVVTMTAFLVIGGLLLMALPLVHEPIAVVAVLILGYGCMSVAIPMANAIVSQIVPAYLIASIMGIFLAIQNLSGLIAPSLVGVLVDHAKTPLDGFSLSYQIFGAAILAGGILTFLLVRPEKDAVRIKDRLEARVASTASEATGGAA